jgi:FkbM family methyltransferase
MSVRRDEVLPPPRSAVSELARLLRPAKIRGAFHRRWFEYRMNRSTLAPYEGELVSMGTPYGGWLIPEGALPADAVCYCVGIGRDASLESALLETLERGTVRSFDPVAEFVEYARTVIGDDPRFTAEQAAITTVDGPLLMQQHHQPVSHSVSAADLYDSTRYVELPGRSLPSLMAEYQDQRIDLLKLDVEGSEYELLPTLDLAKLGVRVLAVQLHHNGTVRRARALIAGLREQGYVPVARRRVIKLTFVSESPAVEPSEEAGRA